MSRASLRRVSVVTCDRPKLVLRCLESYAVSARRFGRDLELAAYDDSADPAVRAETRAGLAALAKKLDLKARYAGPEQKKRFAAALAKAGVPLETALFALQGDPALGAAPTIGANRNSLMLDAAGSMVFMTDDDAVCRVAAVPAQPPRLALTKGVTGLEHWFFPDRPRAMDAFPEKDLDLLGLHEAALGRTVAQLGAPFNLKFDDAPKGRATAVLNGYLGDGGASSRVYLHLRGSSRERLLASEAIYRGAVLRRESVRSVCRLTAAQGAYFMGAFASLDLTEAPPPFPPMGRGEDGSFGALRWALHPENFSALIPYVGLHDPLPARRYSADEPTSAELIINDLVSAAAFAGGKSSMAALAEDLISAARTPKRYAEWLEATAKPRYQRRVAELLALQEDFPQAPDFWRAEVDLAVERWRAALDVGLKAPVDLLDAEAARAFLARFGSLLACWEELFAAARRELAEGRPLSEPV